ncbi:MAG: hypothetical protein K2M76_05580 [Muribaculaceae bacterium]|nr:hypothetical protein [Muribaculaceae bacterium]
MAITNKIGAPVTGDDFYGRKQELIKAHRYLNDRQSLLLSAPRRIGKSSFAKKMIHDKTKEGWKCIYIDLQGIATKEAFIRKLIESFTGIGILEKAGSKAKDFIDSTLSMVKGVSLGDLKLDINNREYTESLLNRLAELFDHDNDTLIVIDELPLFLGKLMDDEGKKRNDVEFLLNWFRSIRQHEDSGIRWMFCGSVGLRNFTNHYRMSQSINDLIDFDLGELPAPEAKGLIAALAESYRLPMDEALITKTLETLQWPIPYFIQLLIDRLISKKHNQTTIPVKPEDIVCAIEELSQSDYFITWAERLDEYRDLENTARIILDSLALADTGLTKDELLTVAMNGINPTTIDTAKKSLTKVLEMLEHDGYIMRNNEYRKFRSPLLRKWWKYKFID